MSMKKALAELESGGLKWVTPSMWKAEHELRTASGDVIARIHRPKWWNNVLYEVDAPGNRWIFERKGLWNRRIEIRSIGTGGTPATFYYQGISGGRLEYADGRVFLWKKGNFWATRWVWTTENGEPVVGFQTGGSLRINADISIAPDQDNDKAPSLLLFLGWYLINLTMQDTAAAS